jgi:hypothetical protein
MASRRNHLIRISFFKECLICKNFLKLHPTLEEKNILKIKKSIHAKNWRHITQHGRLLHEQAIKEK